MRVHFTKMSTGITRTTEFEKRALAEFAVNTGTKCDHDCTCCSTGAVLRMHKSFKEAGESPFGFGYAIVDPDVPARVAHDAKRIKDRGIVQVRTQMDEWSPEAKNHDMGRRFLENNLGEPDGPYAP